jgi:hypothetical protein
VELASAVAKDDQGASAINPYACPQLGK